MVDGNVLRVLFYGLVIAGLLALTSAAQAQPRAGSNLRRGNHVAISKSARLSGGSNSRFVYSNLGRLLGGGNNGRSSSSSISSAHVRSALSRAANSLKGQQHRSDTSGTSGASGSGTSGTSGDPFATVDAASAGTHHQRGATTSGTTTSGTATSGATAGTTTSGTATSGTSTCRAKTSATATSGAITGTTTSGTPSGTATSGATAGTTTSGTTTSGTTTSGLVPNQVIGNDGAPQKAFIVKFSYTPKDQNSHSVAVRASSREKAREKVLAQHPHAVFKSIIKI